MNPTRCFSSQAITKFCSWRNRQVNELLEAERGLGTSVKKIAIHELTVFSFMLFTIISVGETIAYASLALFSLPAARFNNIPWNCSIKLLQSSTFTNAWALAMVIGAVLYPPIIERPIPSHETSYRFLIQTLLHPRFTSPLIRLLRQEDIDSFSLTIPIENDGIAFIADEAPRRAAPREMRGAPAA